MTVVMSQRDLFLASGDDADLPILDAHHHIFDLARNHHPWLSDQRLGDFRYGDYSAICRSFSVADYRAASRAHRVVGSVMVEGEWTSADPLGEAIWASAIARETGLPNALVAQIWLDRDDCDELLAAYSGLPLVRSVRHKPKVKTRTAYRPDFSAPGSMRCSRWRKGFAALAETGLNFDLQAPWWHFVEAAELARDFPRTRIIVNHAGLPADRGDEAMAAWRAALDHLARCPNVAIKVSGIGLPGEAWTLARQAPVIDAAIDAFGCERTAFASNFPVDSLCASFDTIYSVFKQATSGRTPRERLALFHDNAARWYGPARDQQKPQGSPT